MNPFIYQTEGIQCNCFNNNEDSKDSGLKPSRNVLTHTNPVVFHRATKSTQSKVQKEQTSRVKTSLRRQKPKTPNQSTYQQNVPQKPQTELVNLNERLSMKGENQSAKPKWNNLNHTPNFNNQQKIQTINPGTQGQVLSQKRPTLVRNQAPKQNHQNFKNDFNQLQLKNISPPLPNNPVRIVFQNNYQGYPINNIQVLKANPRSQINSTKNININQANLNMNINQNSYSNSNSNSNHVINPNQYVISNQNPTNNHNAQYNQNINSNPHININYNHYNANPHVNTHVNGINYNFSSSRHSNPNIPSQFNNINFQKSQKTVKFLIENPNPYPSNTSIPPQMHQFIQPTKPEYTPSNLQIRRKQSFQTPLPAVPAENKTSRNSKRGSLKGSGYESEDGLPQPQPFRMVLKQIQSVADQNEIFDDERSQVIGRGWQQDKRTSSFENSYQDLHKDQILRTQTHVTRTSHINNSSGIYQNYYNQNHTRR